MGTNWLLAVNNTINQLCGRYMYSTNVTYLNLASNRITKICQNFIDSILQAKNVIQLDISSNMLTSLPKGMQKLKNVRIRLGGNPFDCNCDMLWMISWLANTTLPSGEHLVTDYKNVTCINGDTKEKIIYQLNRVHMGCYPNRMPSWEIALLAIVGSLMIVICMAILVVFRRWKEVKFLLYKHFDILDKRDNDCLDGIKFDGLLSYR